MQATQFPVCNIGFFGTTIKSFFISDLQDLLKKYSFLEIPHKQDFYSLLFIEEAEGEIVVDGTHVRFNNPKIIVIKPSCVSSININNQAKGKIISFTEDFFSLRYNNNNLYQFSFCRRDATLFIGIKYKNFEKWEMIFDLLIQEFGKEEPHKNKVLRSYLNIVLFEVERNHNPDLITKSYSQRLQKIHLFESLVDEHFKKLKFPSEYANLMCLTTNYLNKVCKEELGHTAGNLIRARVAKEAKRMLQYTYMTINEIAEELGFENTSYFVTFFKKETNFPPEQYRKNQHLIK